MNQHLLLLDEHGYNIAVVPTRNLAFEIKRALLEHYTAEEVIVPYTAEPTMGCVECRVISTADDVDFVETINFEPIAVY